MGIASEPGTPAADGGEMPIVLDVEASGFGRDSYPVEIGYVLSDGSCFCSLVRPEPHWTHWDPEAQQLHHISRESAVLQGRPSSELALELNRALHGKTVYTDGWGNDYSWLGTLFEAAGLTPSFRIDSLRALLSESEAAHWQVVKTQVRQELKLRRHRASSDARVLQMTLRRLRMTLPD